ncbi:hypothetical protein Tco_1359983, partial [Tanacetum coccineum]
MVEEPLKLKKKDQINFDEQEAIRLQAEFDEEERIAREKDEANIALTEEWDDIQAKINVDYQLAQRLQAEEQEELTDAEKARLFVQLLEKRRKHFAAKRAKAQRNKPPTKAQQKKTMITYLKNMEGWKLISMDKSKITRKQSKASGHGHENQKSTKPKPSQSQTLYQISFYKATRANLAYPE